jgi:hypothetical protein
MPVDGGEDQVQDLRPEEQELVGGAVLRLFVQAQSVLRPGVTVFPALHPGCESKRLREIFSCGRRKVSFFSFRHSRSG